MDVLRKAICLFLVFAQLTVKTASNECLISDLFQQFKADLCAHDHISLDCKELEDLTTSVTLSCATNHSSVISVTQALQNSSSTIGTTCHDNIRNPLVYRLCNKLCSVTFCSAICDELKVGFYSVCSYCSNRTTHCVIPLSQRKYSTASSAAQNSSSGTTSLPTESGSSVFLTRGSTAIIVLLGILCLVCVLGSLARQKKRGRCFEPSESFGSCPSEPAPTESTQLDPITIPNITPSPRESHFTHVQVPITREHSFTDHDKDQNTTSGKPSSLIEPAPPAYETLESDCSIHSVTDESEEPPPSYSSVVVEAEVAEQRSISLPDLTVV